MGEFVKINYDGFLSIFEEADRYETRIRGNDIFRSKEFFLENNISEEEVKEFISSKPGCKITIIDTNETVRGVYIYSWNISNPDENYAYLYTVTNNLSSYRRSYFYWGYDASERFKRVFKLIFLGIVAVIFGMMVDSQEISIGAVVIFGGLAVLNFLGSIYSFIMGE